MLHLRTIVLSFTLVVIFQTCQPMQNRNNNRDNETQSKKTQDQDNKPTSLNEILALIESEQNYRELQKIIRQVFDNSNTNRYDHN